MSTPQEESEKLNEGNAAKENPAELAAVLALLKSHEDMVNYISTYLLGAAQQGLPPAKVYEHIENVFVKPYLAANGLDLKSDVMADLITFNAAAAMLIRRNVPAEFINALNNPGDAASPATAH